MKATRILLLLLATALVGAGCTATSITAPTDDVTPQSPFIGGSGG